jgi:hypothetical protein
LPITPQEEAGPLYGMILPILISVSLAPGSYFFYAFAAVAIIAAAAANAPQGNKASDTSRHRSLPLGILF